MTLKDLYTSYGTYVYKLRKIHIFIEHFIDINPSLKNFFDTLGTTLESKYTKDKELSKERKDKLHKYLVNKDLLQHFYDVCYADIKDLPESEVVKFVNSLFELCNNAKSINKIKNKLLNKINAIAAKNDGVDRMQIALVFKWILFSALYLSDNWYSVNTNADIIELFDADMMESDKPGCEQILKKFLNEKEVSYFEDISLVTELTNDQYNEVRELLIKTDIDNNEKDIFIAGPSLSNAFSDGKSISLIKVLSDLIEKEQIENLNIFITDPSILTAGLARSEINASILMISQRLFGLCKDKCTIRIIFVPSFEITHCIITPNFLLKRDTKIWTQDREYKGSILLFRNSAESDSEYSKTKIYLSKIMDLASTIDPENDDNSSDDIHAMLRKTIVNHGYSSKNIILKKLYRSQLDGFANSTWNGTDLKMTSRFIPSQDIKDINDLFNPENLLGDNTQSVLLPYIQDTGKMLSDLIQEKKYDIREGDSAVVIPSLDLGYPNNIQRLAGGFATGMLVKWESNVPIVPIDATVNVCSSSVFKINPSQDILDNFLEYISSVLTEKAHKKGFTMNFESGNHFLMIAQDGKNKNDYYLVLHSSPKELKDSYFGLYPVENNWYSSKIKIKKGENGRYLRYIKGEDARFFIQLAHHMEGYNAEIHRWIAKEINQGIVPESELIKNHYYMPTDSSIAIGTFVERPGERVPLFSDVGKPVYIFRISEKDNWTYNLDDNKGRCCLVPHGWGQKIESIYNIMPNLELKTLFMNDGDIAIQVGSKQRFSFADKSIRDFEDGWDFKEKGSRYLKGEIEKTLIPVHLYCSKMKY